MNIGQILARDWNGSDDNNNENPVEMRIEQKTKKPETIWVEAGGTAPPIGVNPANPNRPEARRGTMNGKPGVFVPGACSYTWDFIPDEKPVDKKGKVFVDTTTNNIDLNQVAQRWNDLYHDKENAQNELYSKLDLIIKQYDLESEPITNNEGVLEVFETLCGRINAATSVIDDCYDRLRNWEELI
jgi:hypothetical protein